MLDNLPFDLYTEYKKKFIDRNNILNKACKIIAPLLDLIEIQPLKNKDKSDLISPSLNGIIENKSTISISYNRKFEKGEYLIQTSSDITGVEKLYGITGEIRRNFPNKLITIFYQLKKNDYTKDTIQLCFQFGCGNFNLENILNFPPEYCKIPLNFHNTHLDYDNLKLFKLKYMKNTDDEKKMDYLSDNFVNFSIDVKGDIDYLKTLHTYEKDFPEYEKLLQDYFKLIGIYKGVNNFNQGNLVKTFTGLENKLNLIEVALIRGEILIKQKDLILNKMIKDVQEDLKRLKRKYLL